MDKNNRTSFEKFMVTPSSYWGVKQAGESVRDENKEASIILEYFSEFFTKEQLLRNNESLNPYKIFNLVKSYIQKEYGCSMAEVELNNLYQHSINSYIYNDTENPAVVHIDELLESTVLNFFLMVFKWSKDFDNKEVYGECFKNLLYLMNEVCIFGQIQGEYASREIFKTIAGDIQIFQLAENCFWTALAFSIAHELAHYYIASIGKKYKKRKRYKEEFDADAIAYHIVLKIIMDKRQNNYILEEYTYLVPMMYMDFFDLYFYTDRVLYKTKFFIDGSHPNVMKRKNHLFGVFDNGDYLLDTTDGNHLYSGFLDIYNEYKDQLLLKMHRGKLESIIRREERKARRRKPDDEERSE